MNNSKVSIHQKIISNLFYLFFTSPILSPYFMGKTIYIYILFPFLDIGFYKYLYKKKYNANKLMILTFLFFWYSITYPFYVVRILFIIINLLYIFYSYDNKLFFLFRWVNFNILIALLQLVTFFIDPQIAFSIGPDAIAEKLWGNYSTETWSNFSSIFGLPFPRFSGLSRESGFFASLVAVSLFLYIMDRNIKTKRQYIILILGVLLSLSKVTIALPLLYILMKFKKITELINPIIGTIFLIIIMSLFFKSIGFELIKDKETYVHRFFSYPLVLDVDNAKFILLGKNFAEKDYVDDKYYKTFQHLFPPLFMDRNQGIAAIWVKSGFIGFFLYLLLLFRLRLSFHSNLILILLTATVDPFTVTSFVVLIYFVIFKFTKKLRMGCMAAPYCMKLEEAIRSPAVTTL
jgi:hypothetical protein